MADEITQEINARMSGGLAARLLEVIEPGMESRERKALAPAFRVIAAGEPLDPQLAVQVVVKLYEIKDLRKEIAQIIRKSEKADREKPLHLGELSSVQKGPA